MRVTKKLLKAREQFRTRVETFLQRIGATKPGEYREWNLDTSCGKLGVSVYDNWIACCFGDVDKASAWFGRKHGRLNGYSGKWNWHFSDDPETLGNDGVQVEIEFEMELEKLMGVFCG